MTKVLAIDTSCYTTSIAILEDGKLLTDKRKVLSVKQGQKGLQQSEAVFQHMQNIPHLTQSLGIEMNALSLIAVSHVPRQQINSYLPVFSAGARFAETIGNVLGKEIFYTSHQEGHIAAGEWSVGISLPEKFLAGHFSGGTTEVLSLKRTQYGYQSEIITATSDLHVGQMVDRIGVRLGLPFPAGAALEKLAGEAVNKEIKVPVARVDESISFSGPATAAMGLCDSGIKPADVAFAVFECIQKTLANALKKAIASTKLETILLVGGVMANVQLREFLTAEVPANIYFAKPQYSTDNAVGVAFLGERYLREL